MMPKRLSNGLHSGMALPVDSSLDKVTQLGAVRKVVSLNTTDLHTSNILAWRKKLLPGPERNKIGPAASMALDVP